MKFLTLRQPWASLVAVGAKTVETRPFGTAYRGTLAIHAGLAAPPFMTYVGGWTVLSGNGTDIEDRVMSNVGGPMIRRVGLPLGAVVAVCDLVDVVPIVGPKDWDATEGVARFVVDGYEHDVEMPGPKLTLCGFHENVDLTPQRPFGDFTPGRHAWLLDNIRPVEPVPMKGAQGLRDLPGEVLTQVIAQVSR